MSSSAFGRPARHGRWGVSLLAAVACGACGGQDTGAPPQAHLLAPQHVDVGQTALLDGSRSTDADSDIIRYLFFVADGSLLHSTSAPSVAHVFRLTGRYEVRLEVIDAAGRADWDTATVSVRPP